MLTKSIKTDVYGSSFNLLRCCDEKDHKEMLLNEDYQLELSQQRKQSTKHTAKQNDSDYHHQRQHNCKLPVNLLRKNKEKEGISINQFNNFTFKPLHLHRNSENDARLKGSNILAYQLGLSQKEKKKTSLKHKKRISENQPFLDLSNHHDYNPIYFGPGQKGKKCQLALNLCQNGIILRLGQNLPTVRSQFNYTNQYTQRSQF